MTTCKHCHDVIVADIDGTWVDGDGHLGCPARTTEGPHEPEDT